MFNKNIGAFLSTARCIAPTKDGKQKERKRYKKDKQRDYRGKILKHYI
jgi:hypothetical protein